jgi:hypothetical protein
VIPEVSRKQMHRQMIYLMRVSTHGLININVRRSTNKLLSLQILHRQDDDDDFMYHVIPYSNNILANMNQQEIGERMEDHIASEWINNHLITKEQLTIHYTH